MGKNMSKKRREEEKRERERKLEEEEDRLYEEKLQRKYEEKVKEYNEFISKYEEPNLNPENNVELNEPFMIRGSRPYSVPPHARKKEFKLVKIDNIFELVEQREFNLRKPHTCGGSITIFYVFKPIKKGKGKIIFTKSIFSFTVN